ncbi:two pore calcium channel protein 1A-like isoform X3 [Nicotiana tabacum]|uniref:Two pore calcium channel protein 1A-like isoform X3 n=2 Tax=Nicotiana TaxID=4085 RepID=A0A1S4DRY7_TOBAC|nr:PREDICTED: two pore calcium channel protein 1A-like isoform X4 [Nicotiana sylvestris]XP_016516188.1 PREDICTED: two pore calcium channel protein 1A-like isoform X3 [Nicotiana tabacum]
MEINLDEFARLCNVIALKFEEKDSQSIFEKCPNIYHSPASKKLRHFIRSPTFEYIIVFILLVNLVAVIVETTLDVQNNSAQIFWQKAETIFGIEEITTLVCPHGLTFMSNGNWELFREERRLFTQNAFKQESIHTVAFAAQGKRKDRDMSTTQCYSCKEYGHIVVRSSAVIVSSTGILSKSVPHVLKTIR